MANENSNEMKNVSDPSRAVNDENQRGSESLENSVQENTTDAGSRGTSGHERKPKTKSKNMTIITKLGELTPGDHIAVECEVSIMGFPATYDHHGIYISPNVAHFFGHTVQDAKLKCDDLMVFTNQWKNRLYKIEYKKNQCLPADEVVKRANALVESQEWGAFDFTGNNCEHFASYCKTGKKSCNQRYLKCLVAKCCDKLNTCSVEAKGYSPCFKKETK